jgi:hypothetical protein
MDARYPVYAEADITLVTDKQTPQTMARRIRRELQAQGKIDEWAGAAPRPRKTATEEGGAA